jgi:3-oxoacyl-[acyl-carrier protein] reductase
MAKVLIWGAAGGIGRALTSALLSAGHTVLGAARTPPAIESPTFVPLEADVADDFAVSQAVYSAAQHTDALDLMIYAVGDITAGKIAELTRPTWQRIVDANLTGAYLTTHHTLPLLKPDATLIYIGALHERLRLPGLSAYAAAKAGLEAFADALAKEERKRKILVVRPGAVATPLWEKVPLRLPKDASTPDHAATAILAAWSEGKTGTVDL